MWHFYIINQRAPLRYVRRGSKQAGGKKLYYSPSILSCSISKSNDVLGARPLEIFSSRFSLARRCTRLVEVSPGTPSASSWSRMLARRHRAWLITRLFWEPLGYVSASALSSRSSSSSETTTLAFLTFSRPRARRRRSHSAPRSTLVIGERSPSFSRRLTLRRSFLVVAVGVSLFWTIFSSSVLPFSYTTY